MKKLKTLKKIKKHNEMHINPKKCKYCDQTFKTERTLNRHEVSHSSNKAREQNTHQTNKQSAKVYIKH